MNKEDYPNKIKTNLFSNKTFDIFYYDFTYNQKRHRGLIDLKSKTGWNKRDKIAYAESVLIETKNNKKNNIDTDITFDRFANQHFSLLKDGSWKKIKMSYYDRYLKALIGNKKISSFRQIDIKHLIKDLSEIKIKRRKDVFEQISPRTVKTALEVMNPIFEEAISNRIISHNPCNGVTVKLSKQKKIVSNASDELVHIYNTIVKVFENDPFYKAFYLLALQGRRKSEILNLRKDDISYEHNYYIIRNTKNNETQKMYLPNTVKELLLQINSLDGDYMFTSRKTGKRLQNIEGTTLKLKKEIKNSKFTLHYLRNVITSAMGETGLEAIYQSGALGHNDLTTINKYSSLNYLKGSKMASDVIDGIVLNS